VVLLPDLRQAIAATIAELQANADLAVVALYLALAGKAALVAAGPFRSSLLEVDLSLPVSR
jgi:hypothetical protein